MLSRSTRDLPHESGAACCRYHQRPENGTPYIIGTERMGPRHVIHFHQTYANMLWSCTVQYHCLIVFLFLRKTVFVEERIDFILTMFALVTLLELILRTYLSCRSDTDGDDHQIYKFVACQTCIKLPLKVLHDSCQILETKCRKRKVIACHASHSSLSAQQEKLILD